MQADRRVAGAEGERGRGALGRAWKLLAVLAPVAVLLLSSGAAGLTTSPAHASVPSAGQRSPVPPVSSDPAARGSGDVAVAQALATLGGASPATSTSNWTQVVYPTPTTRIGESFVYDAKDKVYVLFGGWDPYVQVLRDTWELDANGVWHNVTHGTSPPARWGAMMAYDGADGYVVLFGGQGATLSGALSDTWKFSGGTWTKLAPATHPLGVGFGAMAYDAHDSAVLLFGGTTATSTQSHATWEFRAGTWKQLHPAVAPPARASTAMAYDAKDGYAVLFGGASGSTTFGDTWKFVGGNWTNLSATVHPPARSDLGMAFSTADGRVVLFGGLAANGAYLADTWTFGGGIWTQQATAIHPSKRIGAPMADGPAGGRVTLFGGLAANAALDTWRYGSGVWKKVVPLAPAKRYGAMIAYDEADRYVLLFGGANLSTQFGDTWRFSDGVWSLVHPAVSPPAREYGGMVYDSTDGYVLLFGGVGVACHSAYCADTWSYLGGVWTNLTGVSTPCPPGRVSFGFADDPADGYVVLYGGYDLSPLGDTWTYLGGAWTQLAPVHAPTARAQMALTYDSEDGYVLLTGGYTNYAPQTDTWSFQAGVWTNLTGSLTGSAPDSAEDDALFDDTLSGVMILWTQTTAATWQFDGQGWTKLAPPSHPPTVYAVGEGGVYDPADGYGVVLDVDSTWEYTG